MDGTYIYATKGRTNKYVVVAGGSGDGEEKTKQDGGPGVLYMEV